MIEQTTGLGSLAITGNTQNFAYFNNLVNQWYRICAYFAWKTDVSWAFDDTNHSNTPQPTTLLADGQRDYTVPTTALRIRDVEVMDKTGNYYTLNYITEDNLILRNEKEQETKGIPTYYRLVGESIILYPAPDATMVTVIEGLRLTIDREVSEFTVSDTTKEPGLAKQFHPILYYGPSFEYATVKGLKDVSALCLKMLGNFPGLNDMLGDFYANRNKDVVKRIIRAGSKYK